MLIKNICKKFQIQGEYLRTETLTSGHINSTYLVTFFRDQEEKPYIVQKINKFVFKKPEEVMENIANVTEYIRTEIKKNKPTAKRNVLHFQKTADDKYFFVDEKGDYWRCYRFIDESIAYNETDDYVVIEEAGKAFGEFQNLLANYPADTLHITIPNFHNTVDRYQNLKNAIKENSERAEETFDVIDDYLELEDIACELTKMVNEKEIPLRVTHNDTKTNNVLYDKSTKKHLCVIDLDTVMPGIIAHDFGDAIRFIGNSSKEDETDLRKVYIDIAKFEAFTKGFVSMVSKSLTENEKKTLVLGAINMTLECGTRFLTDYLNGDVYFKVSYPGHNLDRAKCQLKLAKSMIRNRDLLEKIVKKYL